MKNDSSVKQKVMCAGEAAPEEPIESRSSTGKHAEATVFSSQTMNIKDNNNTKKSDSTKSGGKSCVPPSPAVPPPSLEGKHTEDEEEDEGYQAPLELMAEFLKAVMDKDFLLAEKLCQMILIYEPENPEASQFLLLIQEKLLRDQVEDQSEDDEDDSNSSDDDDSEDSRSEGKSAQSSGSSSSSSSSSSEEEGEEETQGRRHKPCPPSHLPP